MKICLWGSRPYATQIGLLSYSRWLESRNFGFRKKNNHTFRVAKTKALISFAVTLKAIYTFVFAYSKFCFFFMSWLKWSANSLLMARLQACQIVYQHDWCAIFMSAAYEQPCFYYSNSSICLQNVYMGVTRNMQRFPLSLPKWSANFMLTAY